MDEQELLSSTLEELQSLDIQAGLILRELRKTSDTTDANSQKLTRINSFFQSEINSNLERLRIYDIDLPIAMGRI